MKKESDSGLNSNLLTLDNLTPRLTRIVVSFFVGVLTTVVAQVTGDTTWTEAITHAAAPIVILPMLLQALTGWISGRPKP